MNELDMYLSALQLVSDTIAQEEKIAELEATIVSLQEKLTDPYKNLDKRLKALEARV